MSKKFSSELLRRLRNEIPLSHLITKILDVPNKFSEGHLRFLCPKCNEFRTAINPKTNLSRCFLCEENFNCIDLMMIFQKTDFVQTVEALSLELMKYKLHEIRRKR